MAREVAYILISFVNWHTAFKRLPTLVLCNEEAAVVKETFFGYLRISDSTGKGLLDAFLEKATELQLELSDCRGQSYDNGANMKGKHSGVQARMLDINPKAVYVPCANHTLNLVVVDSAN